VDGLVQSSLTVDRSAQALDFDFFNFELVVVGELFADADVAQSVQDDFVGPVDLFGVGSAVGLGWRRLRRRSG